MTDQQIIQGLIDKDKHITEKFFFEQCKPLLCGIIETVFNKKAEYNELVGELYLYLMENDAEKLRSFQYRCSVFRWLKLLSIRFFIRLRDQGKVIDDESHEPLYEENNTVMGNDACNTAIEDLKRLINAMPNERYAFVIHKLIIDDVSSDALALEMGITTDNLYNIKLRAIRQLTEVALKDIYHYGKQ